MPAFPPAPTRRAVLATLAGAALAGRIGPARAAPPELGFGDLYKSFGVLGLQFSDRVEALKGQTVQMKGFMAPPLKAEAKFFVLSAIPLALCPFCSSDADWPDDIVVVYLQKKQTFVQYNAGIRVTGTLDVGPWIDPETGFVSQLRLRDAAFAQA